MKLRTISEVSVFPLCSSTLGFKPAEKQILKKKKKVTSKKKWSNQFQEMVAIMGVYTVNTCYIFVLCNCDFLLSVSRCLQSSWTIKRSWHVECWCLERKGQLKFEFFLEIIANVTEHFYYVQFRAIIFTIQYYRYSKYLHVREGSSWNKSFIKENLSFESEDDD